MIIIYDCSTDDNNRITNGFVLVNSRQDFIKIFRNNRNEGKGFSIQRGIKEATGDFQIIQNANLKYDFFGHNIMFNPIIRGEADVVYGSRFIGEKSYRMLFLGHLVGNKILTFISNMFTNLNLTDMETVYKMFRIEVIKSIELKKILILSFFSKSKF